MLVAEFNPRKTILLIDDDDTHLLIAQNLLAADYEIVIARSGVEALDLIMKGLYPNLVLLDLFMPNMNGWETYAKIKEIYHLKEIPVAFLTIEDDENVEKHAYSIGVVDFIKKPFEKNDLLKRIKKILAGK